MKSCVVIVDHSWEPWSVVVLMGERPGKISFQNFLVGCWLGNFPTSHGYARGSDTLLVQLRGLQDFVAEYATNHGSKLWLRFSELRTETKVRASASPSSFTQKCEDSFSTQERRRHRVLNRPLLNRWRAVGILLCPRKLASSAGYRLRAYSRHHQFLFWACKTWGPSRRTPSQRKKKHSSWTNHSAR